MATTPKVLLKRSSVAGRIPDSSDLQYGELAINFTDGKLYYKDDSNNIRAFIDSARVQAIADAVEITAQAQLDSSEVTALIDSAYIQTRVPLSYLEGLIDSAYIQARQDFAYSSLTGAPNVLDSADVTNIIDSAYVQARQSANTGTDSATVSAIIAADVDSAYVQSRQIRGADSAWVTSQIPTFGTDYIDSATASNIIVADVTKSFVDALGVNADTLDGFEGAHYLNWTNTTNKPRILDSAMVYRFTIDSARTTGLIDSAYVRARVRTDQDLRTTDSVTFSGLTVSGDLTVTGTTYSVNSIAYTINDPLIHLADSNETSDVVDIGFIGHYYRDGQRRHTGVFRDASNQEYYMYNGLVDSTFDSTAPPNIVNRSGTDFQLATLNVGTLRGQYAGFDSDFNAKSTTNLSEGTNLYYTKARTDSDIAASLTDSGNTVYINTTTIITDQVDSAYVLARVNEAPFLDSADAIALIDSTYVQARQDYAYGSLTGAPTTVSTFTNDAGYLTTATTTALVDSAYIRARRPEEAIFNVVNNGASAYKFTGDGFDSADNPTLYLQRGLTYKFNVNASGHPFEIRLSNGGSAYSTGVTNNANQDSAVYFTPHMDAPNTLVYQCTVHSGMVGDIVIVDNNSFLDSSTVTGVITASYINALTIDADTLGGQAGSYYLNYNNFTNTPTTVDSAEVIKLITANAIDSAVALQLLLDSSEVVNLIDSAYVQARQSGGEITIQDEGTPLSTAATTLNFVGTAVTASGSGTTKTITISQAEGGTDSATVVTIIGETVDSAYVQARQTTGGGGLDSAAVLALSGGSQTGLYQQTFYRFQADSGQTIFTGTDAYGQTLNYGAGAVDVFLNGILLLDSADYTQTSSSTLTLIAAADSADEVHIIWRRGTLVTPNVTTYEYTATGGQVTFSGTAANGKTLAYSAGAIQVFKQGLLLKAGTDYTATDGTSVVLTSGATASDKIAISAYAAPHAKATSFNFTADSAQTTFNGLDNSSTVLSYEPENSLVFLNGIALSDSDFTATNGTSVVLATAANLNDELKVVSFGAVTSTLTNNNWTETATSMKISPNEKKFVDVSSAAVLLEIQDSGSNVSMGDELRIIDGYGNAATNNITLRSTKKIIGSDSDLIIDINRSGTNLVYYNESNGWVLIEN